ncbi:MULTISPECIES: hypothetical protein [unclassified Halobacteriovorax]|uniref:hypothetical protein n=1 Tax=unclassified Halobacteriovorax TaxID=2639665 RepID=UPI0039997326
MISVKAYKESYVFKLCKSATSYFELGMERFLEAEKGDKDYSESILGNICIAIELSMKAYLANKSLALVYERLPDKLYITLLCEDEFQLSDSWSDILNDRLKSITFDRSIKLIETILENSSKNNEIFKKHISELKHIRNNAVHSVLNVVNPVVYISTMYSAIKVIEVLLTGIPSDSDLHDVWKGYSQSAFYINQNEIILAKVKGKINNARSLKKYNPVSNKVDNIFEEVLIDCPACSNKAILKGNAYKPSFANEFDRIQLYSESVECKSCSLVLDGYEELEIAKIPEYVELEQTYIGAEYYWSDFYFKKEIQELFGTKDENIVNRIKSWCKRKSSETSESEYSCMMKMYDDVLDKSYELNSIRELRFLKENKSDLDAEGQREFYFDQTLRQFLGISEG